MTSMNEKIVVRVVVSSDTMSAEEIEARIGLSADRLWRKGEPRLKTIIREKNSGWTIVNEFPIGTEIEEAINVVLRRLNPVGERLRTMGDEIVKELSVIIYCSQLPPMALSPTIVKTLGAHGLGLDFDLFVSGKDS